jgi:hypothetical protein
MTSPRRLARSRFAVLSIVIAFLNACGDVAAPPPLVGGGAHTSSVILQHDGNDADKHATAEARATINSTGVVTLEVTTGRFASGSGVAYPPTGFIQELQVKLYLPTGRKEPKLVSEINLKLDDKKSDKYLPPNNGRLSVMIPGATRAMTLGVKVKVRDVGPKKDDELSADVPVQYSPEIDVGSVPILLYPSGAAPDLVQLNTATDFQITIGNAGPNANSPAEVGALVSCDVFVDGVRLDAPTQWTHGPGGQVLTQRSVFIEPNDAWLFTFTYTFAAEGAHEVKVVANTLDPTNDYNPSNNTSVSTVFVTAATPLAYFATLDETAALNVLADGLVKNATLVALKQQAATISVRWDEPLTVSPVPTDIELKDETNGAVLDARSYHVTIEAELPPCVGAPPRRVGGPSSGEDPISGSVFARPYYENPPQISMCVRSQSGTSRTIQLTYNLSLADGLSGAGGNPTLWPLFPFGTSYLGVPIIHFGETFAFTGSFGRTVNGTELHFGGIKKCVGVLQPFETRAPGAYTRSTSQAGVIPGTCP